MTGEIDLTFAKARRLLDVRTDWSIALCGCGGTGSWLAPHIARLVRVILDKTGRRVPVVFCDPDVVETRNCYRQNFGFAEVGWNKAEALAFRLNAAWGLDIEAFTGPVKDLPYRRNRIFVGCVDKAEGRRQIAGKLDSASWWLDCGNSRDCGQVLLGRKELQRGEKPLALAGYCTWLPSPTVQHPELLVDEAATDDLDDTVGLSCVDLALRDAQSLSINARIAAEAADFLFRLLLTGSLRRYAAYINTQSGGVSSRYIAGEGIGKYLGS